MGALLDAPPLNDRGLVELISPARGGTIILTPDEHAYNAATGAQRLTSKGRAIKFRQGRAAISLEDFELLLEHPAYTGTSEPKIVWLENERQLVHMEDGVRVVDGAQSSATGKLVPPPIRGWNDLAYSKIRAAVKEGMVVDLAGAITYESQHKKREGVIKLLAAALLDRDNLPTATQMAAIDRRAAGPRQPEPAAEPPLEEGDGLDGNPPAAAMATLPSDSEIRDDIARAIAEAEGTDDIGDGDDEPLPGGVI